MKLVKKWLFPVLTCLIVAGAAVLPVRLSEARDSWQFGQVHSEELRADDLLAAGQPTLLDRLEVYSSQYSNAHPILSYRDYAGFDDAAIRKEQEVLMGSAQNLLTGAGILPSWIFEEEPAEERRSSRLLLWDPTASDTLREPAAFWELGWVYSVKSYGKELSVTLDAESGLPVHLWVYDTNMSQWLPYEMDDLRALAACFFDLLGLDVQELDSDDSDSSRMSLDYSITGTAISFNVTRDPIVLSIQPDFNWRQSADANSGSGTYDG